VDSGVKEGAELWQPPCKLPAKGYWFPPTIFTGVTHEPPHRARGNLRAGAERLTFRTVDEAIEKANNTPYGLSAGVWTDKGSRILKMSTELKAGVVWANTYNKFDPTSPFGGYKESGFGREGGRQGLLDYCQTGSNLSPAAIPWPNPLSHRAAQDGPDAPGHPLHHRQRGGGAVQFLRDARGPRRVHDEIPRATARGAGADERERRQRLVSPLRRLQLFFPDDRRDPRRRVWGKYRTIFWLSLVYCAGSVVLALTTPAWA
jgi:hypothetical protein